MEQMNPEMLGSNTIPGVRTALSLFPALFSFLDASDPAALRRISTDI